VRLRCPKCSAESEQSFNPLRGKHHEYNCVCGAKLQCDFPVQSGGSLPGGGFSVEIGPPQHCAHEDRRDPSAHLPILVV